MELSVKYNLHPQKRTAFYPQEGREPLTATALSQIMLTPALLYARARLPTREHINSSVSLGLTPHAAK